MSTPDARRAGPGVGWRERRTGPRHAAVWVRTGGQWRKGRIIEWVTEPGAPGWDCVILADEPPGSVPWQGRYVYDPAAIRRRDGDTPPGELPLPRLSGTHCGKGSSPGFGYRSELAAGTAAAGTGGNAIRSAPPPIPAYPAATAA